jgi:AbiTii
MPGLIEEIQRDAFDQNIPVSALLRKVKAAASKLNLPPTEKWVEQELNGYDEAPPDYRELNGRPKALNPYHGWIPIIFDNDHLNDMLATCSVRQSVASLEALIKRNEGSFVQFPIAPGMVVELNKVMNVSFGTMAVHLSTSQIHGLLDAVRNLVLEWALKLERAGISGEGMSFNKEEKQLANTVPTTFNIGSIGSMIGNLGSQNSSGAISASHISVNELKDLVEQLKPHVAALEAAGADAKLLDRSLALMEKQTEFANPDQQILRGMLTDLRNALSGAAGSLIASGAVTMITAMLGG